MFLLYKMLKWLSICALALFTPVTNGFDCTNFNEQMCVANRDKCNWTGPMSGCWNRWSVPKEAINVNDIDCTIFNEPKCIENSDKCMWIDAYIGCWNKYVNDLNEMSSLEFTKVSDFYNLSADRQCLMVAAKALYDQRSNEIYTGDYNKRWIGIWDKVKPPSAPKYSDCSAAVSWIYWTCFGNGPDFINRQQWNDGYTGTLDQNGNKISLNDAQPGDLVFYGNPIDHVAIYIGSGRVISHGSDPVCNCDVHYRNDLAEVRSYLSSNQDNSVDCYQQQCSDFDYDQCLSYPNDCVYVDFQGCKDKRDLLQDVDCDNLDREQCIKHPKECIYIGCSYGCPGCMFRNETSETIYDKALQQGVIPVDYDWRHSAFACCPVAIKDGLECGLDPLCILYAIIRNKCPQKCAADLCHNVPSTCRREDEVQLGSIQSSIQHATSDYWGRSTSAGPDGGVEACAWAVNNIISNAGYRKVGDNPDYVPSVVAAIKAGRGRQIQAVQAVPGDLVVACGEQHIGVCMENNCNTIDSNSSSRRCFCWRSGFNFDNYFNCGPATYWRIEN